MDANYDNIPNADAKIVYVRPVLVADLPDELREKAGDIERLFAVHNSDGDRMALVADRKLAFALAREHDFSPVNVH
ncbi:DUF1150 family protein [Pacificibacter marinus]|uniref:DUF1150 domain-containing protein n=1 Tax=Pacificibacter marinus TaxID=658057 RepID=A0A1Y5R9Z4_9RHOB|nr:DUF1150 family protein [Pacificibacter marinus]SEK26479.1 hypothetical protein SAMN04488032_101524 [Pacificibacter marinus]SLN12485.1 hypothetical protein PAM7971_00123 [Pacificibacter marinus]